MGGASAIRPAAEVHRLHPHAAHHPPGYRAVPGQRADQGRGPLHGQADRAPLRRGDPHRPQRASRATAGDPQDGQEALGSDCRGLPRAADRPGGHGVPADLRRARHPGGEDQQALRRAHSGGNPAEPLPAVRGSGGRGLPHRGQDRCGPGRSPGQRGPYPGRHEVCAQGRGGGHGACVPAPGGAGPQERPAAEGARGHVPAAD